MITKIRKDKIQAMKDKDTIKLSLLRVVDADATNLAKKKENRDPTDAEVIKIFKSVLKNTKETLCLLKDGDPIMEIMAREVSIINSYLPQQLSESELRLIITNMIEVNGFNTIKNMGWIMKKLQSQHDGQYDGKLASSIVKEELKNA